MSAIDVACEIGKSIITDHAVTSATQTLMTSTISGGAQIVGAAATGGNVSAAVSAAGASISSASAGVGNAVMGTQVVSMVSTLLASPAAPFVIGAGIIAGLWWLCRD